MNRCATKTVAHSITKSSFAEMREAQVSANKTGANLSLRRVVENGFSAVKRAVKRFGWRSGVPLR